LPVAKLASSSAANGTRTVRMSIRPGPASGVMNLTVDAPGSITSAVLNGHDVTTSPANSGNKLQFTYSFAGTQPPLDIAIGVRSEKPVSLTIEQISDGLPFIPGLVIKPRPAWMMEAPTGAASDRTVVLKSFQF
jgi:hypothetical protein